MDRRPAGSWWGAALLFLAACDGDAKNADAGNPAPQIFVALPEDFYGFQSWEAFHFDGPQEGDAGVHISGRRDVYLKQQPPHGATAFPVGTIIVKSFPDEPTNFGPRTFAMAKRGGNYNSTGAPGWEWFELDLSNPATPATVWRGLGPPVGDIYAGTNGGTCNDCHGAAKSNDSVQSAALQLSSF
jgi:hypothetical protein